MSINKPTLIDEIAEKTGQTKADTDRFLTALEDVVTSHVVEGDDVKISGFVAFSPSVRAARVAKNPRTGEDLNIPESKVVRIRPLKAFKDKVSGN